MNVITGFTACDWAADLLILQSAESPRRLRSLNVAFSVVVFIPVALSVLHFAAYDVGAHTHTHTLP